MDQLKDVLDQQDSGKQNLTLRLKQRALQGAYDTAVKKKKARCCFVPVHAALALHGVALDRHLSTACACPWLSSFKGDMSHRRACSAPRRLDSSS